ncbi:MAG: hypothetical protein ACTH0V_05190 [Microbacteriaceae bacterium]
MTNPASTLPAHELVTPVAAIPQTVTPPRRARLILLLTAGAIATFAAMYATLLLFSLAPGFTGEQSWARSLLQVAGFLSAILVVGAAWFTAGDVLHHLTDRQPSAVELQRQLDEAFRGLVTVEDVVPLASRIPPMVARRGFTHRLIFGATTEGTDAGAAAPVGAIAGVTASGHDLEVEVVGGMATVRVLAELPDLPDSPEDSSGDDSPAGPDEDDIRDRLEE